jgi:HEAT repeat protein
MTNYDPEDQSRPERPDIETTLSDLREGEESSHVTATVFYGLSGLQPAELAPLAAVWDSLSADYRRHVVSELAEASEANFDLDYDALGLFALNDDDEDVRAAAIDLVWENETPEVMDRLIAMARHDEAIHVRAAAMSALGRFILSGELEELPDSQAERAQQTALDLLSDPQVDVRRRALEALANSSHEIVPGAIEAAYTSDEHKLRVSAVFAMGRTCDETWSAEVLEALQSDDAELRYEAARAAGELMLEDAIKHLRKLALDDDREIKEVAIWSLGEIGGSEAARALERLAKDAETSGDEELLEAIEDALSSATLGSSAFYMMRYEKDE